MNNDDKEQLEYIENWNKKQREKLERRENKKANIRMHYTRCKEYLNLVLYV